METWTNSPYPGDYVDPSHQTLSCGFNKSQQWTWAYSIESSKPRPKWADSPCSTSFQRSQAILRWAMMKTKLDRDFSILQIPAMPCLCATCCDLACLENHWLELIWDAAVHDRAVPGAVTGHRMAAHVLRRTCHATQRLEFVGPHY